MISGHGTGRPVTVLHVDDDRSFLELTAEFLRRANPEWSIQTTTDPDDGLAYLRENEVDCVVSDYDMPAYDGLAFLERVREAFDDLPFVLFTGKGSEEIASEAISAGVTEYLQKQPGTEQYALLANKVANAARQYRTRRTAEETKQTLTKLTETTNDSMWMFDADWSELLFINSAYEDIWGRSTERLAADPQDFLEGVHPDDRDRVEARMADLSAGRSVDFEFRVDERENYERWVWVQGEPVTNEAGETEKVVGFVRDITDRKHHEQQLARERQFVEDTLDAIDDLFFVFDADGRLVRWNDRVIEVTGYAADELDGMAPTDFFAASDADRIERAIEQLEREGRMTMEVDLQTKDGDLLPYEFKSVQWVDDDGTVRGLCGVGRDIADRKRREQRLRQYETIVESIDDAAWMVDTDGRIVSVNGAVLERVGKDLEDVVGLLVEEFLPLRGVEEGRASEYLAELDAVLAGDRDHLRVELPVKGGAGDSTFDVSVVPVRHDGEVQGAVGISRRITERKRYERELERQNERLDEFAGIVSHDLRNPLNIAMGSVELAAEECDSDHLDAAVRALNRMDDLISDILLLARYGKTVLEPSVVRVDRVADRAWSTVETGASALELDADRAVLADERRLQRLFENLFSNAVTHSDNPVTVRVGTAPGGFYVEDTGPGIPPGRRDEVFNPGYSTGEAGTGLGLVIVEQIATGHGWSVTVTEGSDGGTRVSVTGVDEA